MSILPSPRTLRLLLLPALYLSTMPVALAQEPTGATIQPLPQSNDPAELLARALRTLATEPNNLDALKTAGQNALALGDPNAAVGFFGRADGIASNDGAVKAGLGSALVLLEKPQEALRLFAEASRRGVPDLEIASDRGLAYDLTGDQKKAQRDYALVLAAHPNDETARRRLALSQGISGDRAAALATLDPLVNKRDVAGWRARTFVLAMTGDVKGAGDIIKVMMPQEADLMQPFLLRLVTLSAAGKARAVNFGDIPADGHNYTPAQLETLGTHPTYAQVPASDLAAAHVAAPSSAPAAAVSAPPAAATQRVQQLAPTTAAPSATAGSVAPVLTTPAPGAADPGSLTPPDLSAMPVPAAQGHYDLPHVAADRRTGSTTSQPDRSARQQASDDDRTCTTVKTRVRARHSRRSHLVSRTVCKTRTSAEDKASAKKTTHGSTDEGEDCRTVKSTTRSSRHRKGHVTTHLVCKTRKSGDDDSKASASDKAPTKKGTRGGADEGEDCTTVKSTTRSSRHRKGHATTHVVCKTHKSADDDSKASAGDKASAKKGTRGSADEGEDCTPAKPTRASRHHKGRTAAKPVCKTDDDDSSSGKTAKGSTTKGGKTSTQGKHKATSDADDDDGADKGSAKSTASAKSTTGARYYVQVAGGTNKGDLGKAWASVQKKAPELMKGKTPSTTPLRATHRLVVGPFKDEDEAQAFVNKMSAKGLSGFVVKTEKRQKVEKIDAGQ